MNVDKGIYCNLVNNLGAMYLSANPIWFSSFSDCLFRATSLVQLLLASYTMLHDCSLTGMCWYIP